jgi:hypothetical protein
LFKTSSIKRYGQRVAVEQKSSWDPTAPGGQDYPDADYYVNVVVYDCERPVWKNAEETVISKSGEVLRHYKWADPQLLDLSVGVTTIIPGSIGDTARQIVCSEDLRTPVLDKSKLVAMNFTSLSSTNLGDGEIYYEPVQEKDKEGDQRTVTVITKYNKEHKIAEITGGWLASGSGLFLFQVQRVKFKCSSKRAVLIKTEFYSAGHELTHLTVSNLSKDSEWVDVPDQTPFALLWRVTCDLNEVQK